MCGCAPATGINSPRGGVHNPLRASLARSPPRLGRSQAGGLHPQTPRAAPLARLRAPGPCCLGHPAGGFRARVRRWRGWATACGCPCPTPSPSPSPLDSVFQKQGNRSVGKPQALSTGGRQSLQRRRWADPGTARRAAVPPWVGSGVVHGQSGPQGRAPAPPGTRFPPAAGSALCRFIRENDSCEFGKNPALARARARLLVFLVVKFDTAQCQI